MEAHVQAIAEQAKGVGAIITDTERFNLAKARVATRKNLIPGLTFPKTATHTDNLEWQWLVAPAGDEHETQDIEHTVITRLYERYEPTEGEEDDALADGDGEDGDGEYGTTGSTDDGLEDD